jgi:hypothetical protein
MPVRKYILIFIFTVSLSSCSKELQDVLNGGTSSVLEQYFEANVINQNFVISLAVNNGVDITSSYSGYVCKMLKTDYYHGPCQITKGTSVYMGTWSSNNDYSKLVITLPTTPSIFVFLNREWRFTKKALPEMELAPWGTTEPLVLHMLRQ